VAHRSKTTTTSAATTAPASTTRSSTSEATETETESSKSSENDGHGDAVRQGVVDCKVSAAASGKHGIGHCVSPIASSHGHGHS
jgi:hypothetical protein